MAFYVETVSLKGWSRGALDYLLYLAEHPMATSREICDAVGLSYRSGQTASHFRKHYPGWREAESELRGSPEAGSVFLARIALPSVTKAMINQTKSGKSSVSAAHFLREQAAKSDGAKPDGMPDWMEDLLKPKALPAPHSKPAEEVIEAPALEGSYRELLS